MKPVFYTIDCNHCLTLEKKLKEKKIDYEECRDIEIMQEKGFTDAPMLELDGKYLKFTDAMKWVESV